MRTHRFLILSEPRTGSNNVSYCLAAHPELVVGNELLHPQNGVRPSAYGLDDALAAPTGGIDQHWITGVDAHLQEQVLNSLFDTHDGFKIHLQHLPADLIAHIIEGYDCRVILVRRLSLFDQAISNYIATARNRWHADEKLSKMVDAPPFEIPTDHFVEWLEWILASRKAMRVHLRWMPERVALVEFESFYSGTFEQRVERVDALYRLLGLAGLDQLEADQRQHVDEKLHHYLDSGRQKLTDAALMERLVLNLSEIRQTYSLWVMQSFGMWC